MIRKLIPIILFSCISMATSASPSPFFEMVPKISCTSIFQQLSHHNLTIPETFEKIEISGDSAFRQLNTFIGLDIELILLNNEPSYIPGKVIGYLSLAANILPALVKDNPDGTLEPIISKPRLIGHDQTFASADGKQTVTGYIGVKGSFRIKGKLLGILPFPYKNPDSKKASTGYLIAFNTEKGPKILRLTDYSEKFAFVGFTQ